MADLVPVSLLDAVNTCLAAIGESPVDNVEITDLVTVVLAKQFIAERSRSLQSMTWGFNSDEDYLLARDENLKIPVPPNALRVDTTREFSQFDVVYRAGFLYDRAQRSFTFDRDVKCNITWYFDFTDLPEAARWYITVSAARTLQARMLAADARERFTKEDEERAWATLKDAEGDTGDHNMFNGSYSVAGILDRSADNSWPIGII